MKSSQEDKFYNKKDIGLTDRELLKLTPFLEDFSKVIETSVKLFVLPSETPIFTTGYMRICDDFFKGNISSLASCEKECLRIKSRSKTEEEVLKATCENGLAYLMSPIKIFGETAARVYVGPLSFVEKTDHELYHIAGLFDFPQQDFIDAWREMRTIDKEFLDKLAILLTSFTSTLGIMLSDNIEARQANEALKETLKKQALLEREKQQLLDELQLIFDNSQVGIAYLQGGRFVARVNNRLADMFLWNSPEEMVGLDLEEVHLTHEHYVHFGQEHYSDLAKGRKINIEYQLKRKDGTSIWCNLSGKAVDTADPIDLTKGVIWIIDDITHRKKLERSLRYMATTDHMTGLHNRSSFLDRASDLLDRRGIDDKVALFMIDIDKFKDINDTYGHDTGDKVLCHFAKKMRNLLKEDIIGGRIGGDEFSLFMADTSALKAHDLAEKLRESIYEDPYNMGNQLISYTLSIGITVERGEELSLEELLKKADEALYDAKEKGRDRISIIHKT